MPRSHEDEVKPVPLLFDRLRVYLLGMDLVQEISSCELCVQRFAATATRHRPRPVPWFKTGARILVASQAPGVRVHEAGKPFFDRSGDRLREWMGVDADTFYDKRKIAFVPMAFCFPGYDSKGSDLPPPAICAKTWRQRVMDTLQPDITLLVGGHAQGWHLGTRGVTDTVRDWQSHAPRYFPLPHPSWRNTGWLKRNPWFEADLLPSLRENIARILATYSETSHDRP